MERFPMNANILKEVLHYVNNRNIQLLSDNVLIYGYKELKFGVHLFIRVGNDDTFNAIYVYERFRDQGFYKHYVTKNNLKIFTINDCNIVKYLSHNKIPHFVGGHFLNSMEYCHISESYESQKAKRSDVYLMNHIDEGLYILNKINASDEAKRAYCMHPLLQHNDALVANINSKYICTQNIIILTMEYRKTANAYLSQREIKSLDDIELSPLKDVNDMLIADKIQNRKDFELYHKGKHERSEILDQYFKNWLERLCISEKFYQETLKELKVNILR